MKNWILWLVLALIFIGGSVTFFILWNKEKKKTAALGAQKSGSVNMDQPKAVSNPSASENTVVAEQMISGRNVSQTITPTFGSVVQ